MHTSANYAADTTVHAIERAWERFRVDWTVSDLNLVAGMIQRGESLLQGRYPEGMERHIIAWQEKFLPVLYHAPSRHIVTVLPNFRLYRQK